MIAPAPINPHYPGTFLLFTRCISRSNGYPGFAAATSLHVLAIISPIVIAMRILVIEDEAKVASFIRRALEAESYAGGVCADGAKALELASGGCYDLVILDLMLPGHPGMEVLKALRRHQVSVPVLILTAQSQVTQKVTGLDAGADDYLTKPFAIEELLARVRALLRRGSGEAAGLLQVEDLVRSEEHTSELQSHHDLVCRLLLEKKKDPPATLPATNTPPAPLLNQ